MIGISRLYDVVALIKDVLEANLVHGQVGTMVNVQAGGAGLEVEFSDSDGRTYESLGLRPEQLLVLRHEPAIGGR